MRLHEQVKYLQEQNSQLLNGINEIRRYLNSEKFSIDIMVNKNDILLRINEIDYSPGTLYTN